MRSRNPNPCRLERDRALRQAERFALGKYAAGCALVALLGCDGITRVNECRAFARSVNPALDRIAATIKPNSPQAYRKASHTYTALAGSVRKLRFSSQPGERLVTEYAELLTEASASLTRYADSLEGSDQEELEASSRALRHLTRRQQILVKRFQSFCLGR